MNAGEFLTPAEVRELAGCAAREAQRQKLAELGVPFIRDGERILVCREHVRQRALGIELRASSGVNWNAVR